MTKTFPFRGVVATDPAEKDTQALQRAKNAWTNNRKNNIRKMWGG